MFGNLGFSELLVIFAVALVVFGPHRLPEIARTLGRALGQFRRAASDLRETVEREVHVDELRRATDGLRAASRELDATGGELRRAVVARAPDRAPPEQRPAPAVAQPDAGDDGTDRTQRPPAVVEAPAKAPPGPAAKGEEPPP